MRCWLGALQATGLRQVRSAGLRSQKARVSTGLMSYFTNCSSNTWTHSDTLRIRRGFCITRHPASQSLALSPSKYLSLWAEINHKLGDEVSDLPEIEDLELGADVVKVIAEENKVIVINSHIESKQIWYSSPVSGPRRFDLIDLAKNEWRDRNNIELFTLFKADLSKLLKR